MSATSLSFSVYGLPNVDGIGAKCRNAGDAAAIVGLYGTGTIKADGRIVWREGKEAIPGGEFDAASDIINKRVNAHHVERLAKLGYTTLGR